MENNNAKKLYNVAEACKLLGIGKAKVYALIKNDYLHALDLGGLKIPDAELNRFINNYVGYSFKDMSNPCRLDIALLNS